MLLAHNRDEHILAIKKLVANESIDNKTIPENVRVFAKNCSKQKKGSTTHQHGVLCVKYPKNQRALQSRPCMIKLPQLY